MRELTDADLKNLVPKDTILLGYRGSVAHGMYVPGESKDIDLLGVMIAPLSHYYGLANYLGVNQRGNSCFERKDGEYDAITYEIRRFAELCASGNPNALPLLWLETEFYLKMDEIGHILTLNRAIFSSKRVFASFSGFALEQIKWYSEAFAPDEAYYRKASHAIRLLRMAVEFLETGVLQVWRQDSLDFLQIKRGLWTPGAIKLEAEALMKRAEIAETTSKLPEKPDMAAVDALLIECIGRSRY